MGEVTIIPKSESMDGRKKTIMIDTKLVLLNRDSESGLVGQREVR